MSPEAGYVEALQCPQVRGLDLPFQYTEMKTALATGLGSHIISLLPTTHLLAVLLGLTKLH